MKSTPTSAIGTGQERSRVKESEPEPPARTFMTHPMWSLLTSLRLTVTCLAFGIVLVFLGTLAQVNEGLWSAQDRWFRSFFIWWGPAGASWRIPVFPGGYLVGVVLLANLLAAHIKRFQFTQKKFGIHLTHLGIILLLIGQLVTDMRAQESHLSLREGETKNYSESHREHELVFATDVDDGKEKVIAVPESWVREKREVTYSQLPFALRVKEYGPNAEVRQRAPAMDKGEPPASHGFGPQATVVPLAETKEMDKKNFPYAVIELVRGGQSLGTWLLSPFLTAQTIEIDGRPWRAELRAERIYKPFAVMLLKTTHEVYPGTQTASNPQGIPKNFQSRVRIDNPAKAETREVDIYMNNPLRYEGLTFFQYQMGRDEMAGNIGTSTFQVVRNPAWVTPYLGCVLVGAGMIYQFLFHLTGFIKKRKHA